MDADCHHTFLTVQLPSGKAGVMAGGTDYGVEVAYIHGKTAAGDKSLIALPAHTNTFEFLTIEQRAV